MSYCYVLLMCVLCGGKSEFALVACLASPLSCECLTVGNSWFPLGILWDIYHMAVVMTRPRVGDSCEVIVVM